jgi:protoheme IX farnesyltransferase
MSHFDSTLAGQGAELTASAPAVSEASVRDFVALLKPRVMSLVVFTALVGLVAAPGTMHPGLAGIAILCIALGGGASGALNMWYDADIDAVMSRTAKRPIPSGKVLPGEALGFGLFLAGLSVVTLGMASNWVAAGLLAFTIFFYAVVYTMWLKRSTPQNIVIGGAAGAFPPMIGWAAVTGGFSLESLVMFAIIFIWTPPHFWALALMKKADYGRAGVPMLPNVVGDDATRRQILWYTIAMAATGCLPALLGYNSLAYLAIAAASGLWMIRLAADILRADGGPDAARASWRMFGHSMFYLFGLFLAILVDKLAMRAGLLGGLW